MARPFKKILCPVDFSENSLTALAYATDFARQNNGQLILLHVIDNPLADQYGPKGRNFFAEVEHALEWSNQRLADCGAHPCGQRSLRPRSEARQPLRRNS